MGISLWQIIVVLILVILLFGRNRISDLMGDVAKGITSFKKGLKEDGNGADQEEKPAKSVEKKAKPSKAKSAKQDEKAKS